MSDIIIELIQSIPVWVEVAVFLLWLLICINIILKIILKHLEIKKLRGKK